MKKISLLLIILTIFAGISVTNIIRIDKSNSENLVQLAKKNPEILKDYPELANKKFQIKKDDTVNFVFRNIQSDILKSFPYIIIFIIISFASSSLFKKIKSNIIKDMSLRENYKKIINKEILKSYLYSLVPILFLLILFIMSIIYNFDLNYKKNCSIGKSCYMQETSFQFFIFLIINLIIISLYYINISLIFINFNKKFFLNIISSFLAILGIEIILQCFVGPLFASMTDMVSFGNVFSSSNLWIYDSLNYGIATTYTLLSFLISFIVLKKIYSNREKVFIQNVK